MAHMLKSETSTSLPDDPALLREFQTWIRSKMRDGEQTPSGHSFADAQEALSTSNGLEITLRAFQRARGEDDPALVVKQSRVTFGQAMVHSKEKGQFVMSFRAHPTLLAHVTDVLGWRVVADPRDGFIRVSIPIEGGVMPSPIVQVETSLPEVTALERWAEQVRARYPARIINRESPSGDTLWSWKPRAQILRWAHDGVSFRIQFRKGETDTGWAARKVNRQSGKTYDDTGLLYHSATLKIFRDPPDSVIDVKRRGVYDSGSVSEGVLDAGEEDFIAPPPQIGVLEGTDVPPPPKRWQSTSAEFHGHWIDVNIDHMSAARNPLIEVSAAFLDPLPGAARKARRERFTLYLTQNEWSGNRPPPPLLLRELAERGWATVFRVDHWLEPAKVYWFRRANPTAATTSVVLYTPKPPPLPVLPPADRTLSGCSDTLGHGPCLVWKELQKRNAADRLRTQGQMRLGTAVSIAYGRDTATADGIPVLVLVIVGGTQSTAHGSASRWAVLRVPAPDGVLAGPVTLTEAWGLTVTEALHALVRALR